MIDESLSEGALLFRSYPVSGWEGEAGQITITLGHPSAGTLSSRFAAQVGADA